MRRRSLTRSAGSIKIGRDREAGNWRSVTVRRISRSPGRLEPGPPKPRRAQKSRRHHRPDARPARLRKCRGVEGPGRSGRIHPVPRPVGTRRDRYRQRPPGARSSRAGVRIRPRHRPIARAPLRPRDGRAPSSPATPARPSSGRPVSPRNIHLPKAEIAPAASPSDCRNGRQRGGFRHDRQMTHARRRRARDASDLQRTS